jgi:hypothetical protein
MVTFAVALPMLIAFLVLVVDVGNWFAHRRHLQTQADAAALAAAGAVRVPCSDAPIEAAAQQYGGGEYNPQLGGGQPRVQMRINSETWYGQSSPVDDTVDVRPPCQAKMIDVKMTETDLPWFFGVGIVDFINTRARVSINKVDAVAGALPVAVQEVNPKRVRVTFIDESNGEELGSRELVKTPGTTDGLVTWNNEGDPLPLTVDRGKIGVRVAMSGNEATVTCGQAGVECYDAESSNGILYVRGWDTSGGPGEPVAKDVWLTPGTCNDAYFSLSTDVDCTIAVRAEVDIGSTDPKDVKLNAVVGGKTYALSYSAGVWESAANVPIQASAGPVPVELKWEKRSGTVGSTTCTNSNPCKDSFGQVHRSFAATGTRSGPIMRARVREGIVTKNSFQRCSDANPDCTHDLIVDIGVTPGLDVAQSFSDPVVSLRFAGGGSQSQGLDCDPEISTYKEEIARGCSPTYAINTGQTFPGNAAALWSTAQPWYCVASQTGQYVNQIPPGLNLRILGDEKPSTCTSPNNWPNYQPGDPRIVDVFLTEFGAFDDSGSSTVPVTDFATFYVTGWGGKGQGFKNPCQGNGDDPVPDGGYIVGHFIKYIKTLNDGTTGSQPCDFSGPTPCIAVLTE